MTDKIDLGGRVAIVTGAASGMGAVMAAALLDAGARVAGVDVDGVGVARMNTEWRNRHNDKKFVGVLGDVSSLEDCRRVVAQTVAEFGGLDILVNNAGATKRGDFLELTDADWEDGYALKFFGHMRLARAAWLLLKERHGSLISIGGTGARKPTAQFTIGSSVNSAVAAFTKCLADRGKTDGVQVNCIHPSVVETDRTRRRVKAIMESTGKSEQDVRNEIFREFNTIRFGKVEDVGDLVAFIVSSRGSWLQGATIDLDGGEIPTL